jgi:hypothetical protein
MVFIKQSDLANEYLRLIRIICFVWGSGGIVDLCTTWLLNKRTRGEFLLSWCR